MKIVKKTKEFVKENWKPLVTGAAIGGGLTVAYALGVRTGKEGMLNIMNRDFGMDLRQVFGISQIGEKALKDVTKGGLTDQLTNVGFSDLDDKLRGVVLIQKI